jgi:hypothetical protein
VRRLWGCVETRLTSRKAMPVATGAIINTCGWVTPDGLACLAAIARVARATHVAVLGTQRLAESFRRALESAGLATAPVAQTFPLAGHARAPAPVVQIANLESPLMIARRSADERRAARDARIRSYFYGKTTVRGERSTSPAQLLSPHRMVLCWDDIEVYEILPSMKHNVPRSALPEGDAAAAAQRDPIAWVDACIYICLYMYLICFSVFTLLIIISFSQNIYIYLL